MDELEKLLAKHRQEKAKGKDNSTADEMFREMSTPVYPLLEDDPHFVPGLVSEV